MSRLPESRFKKALRPAVRALRGAAGSVRRRLTGIPAIGQVDFGDLRRTRPLCPEYGYDRGVPVDRIYIERFLESCSADIAGRVLEILDDDYTVRFGQERVTSSDVLDIDPANPQATIIADLQHAPHLADELFDTIIFTQTLQLIFHADAALATLHRLLRPGGILLMTVPGVTLVGQSAGEQDQWCWAFTAHSVRRLLEASFGARDIAVQTYGNVLTATSFLQGIAAGELLPEEFDVCDPGYPVTIAARAIRTRTD